MNRFRHINLSCSLTMVNSDFCSEEFLFIRMPEPKTILCCTRSILKTKLWINKIDAAKLSIKKPGDKVLVHSLYTKTGFLAHRSLCYRFNQKKSVFMAHGFGHISKGLEIAYHLGAADSFLVSNDIDPISGAAAFNNAFVTLKKV